MIIEINIDCEKTEKALKGLSALTGKRISDLIKEELDLNGMLISVAEAIKEKPDFLKAAKRLGNEPFNDLMGILS